MKRRIVKKRMKDALYNILKNSEKPSCICVHNGTTFFVNVLDVEFDLCPIEYPIINIRGMTPVIIKNGDIYAARMRIENELNEDGAYIGHPRGRDYGYKVRYRLRKAHGGRKR